MDFLDNFELADAAIIGGIAGFVQDSLKSEDKWSNEDGFDEEDFARAVEDEVALSGDTQLRLLYNENPGLVRFLIRKVYEDREKAVKAAEEKEIEQVNKEMREEIERMEADAANRD